ncbi:MAG: hypothetical protein KKI09_12030 [Spirochaetes bacterium]|nr:hypothetical protein [Spirochaetota bacterium]MBU0956148.1 hypothetical protein [Spirochaetota bacterium]
MNSMEIDSVQQAPAVLPVMPPATETNKPVEERPAEEQRPLEDRDIYGQNIDTYA